MDRDTVKERLKKIHMLAERGIGGEKEQARKIYERLLDKYEIEDEEIADKPEIHWFRFKNEIEESLLIRIFYTVTGGNEVYQFTGPHRNRKQRGVLCTEAEAAEIDLLYSFYREGIKKEINVMLNAFFYTNDLFPDESRRLYDPSEHEDTEISDERKIELRRIAAMAMYMDRITPPRALIESEG